MSDGFGVLVAAAQRELEIEPRPQRWTHLSLCVLDAVFSINARYSGVVRVCRAYADHAGLPDPLLPTAVAHTVIGTDRERSVAELADLGRELGDERLAIEVFRNRARTSARGGIRKAAAAVQYAQVLAEAGLERIGQVTAALADASVLAPVEHLLSRIPGHGSGARLSYLWMLAGDDNQVKPDRMVIRWLERHLGPGHQVSTERARDLLAGLAERLSCTPWEVDHAVWQYESAFIGRR